MVNAYPITTEVQHSPMTIEPFKIQRVIRETTDTFTLELVSTSDAPRPAFEPGQFNMLYVFGVGEIPISISGDPADQNLLVHTTRVVGTVTAAMNELHQGDTIGIRGPFGTTWRVAEAFGNDLVFVAGGIGLAPLRPALYYALANRDKYGKIVILYGTRSPDDILFRKELETWRSRFDLEVHVTVDYADPGWRGNVGVVTKLIAKAPFDAENILAMTCGPEVMMRYTAIELVKRGVAPQDIDVSMERNMKCALGFCGHCQYGPYFICKDGPVFSYDNMIKWLNIWEV